VSRHDTEFFERAEMMDTEVGFTEKDDAAEVANNGFEAMMKGQSDVVSGFKNKVQSAVANVMSAGLLAGQHRKIAKPGPPKYDARLHRAAGLKQQVRNLTALQV
jgi:uncharacterized protein